MVFYVYAHSKLRLYRYMCLYNSIYNYSNSGYVAGTVVTMLFLVLFAFHTVTGKLTLQLISYKTLRFYLSAPTQQFLCSYTKVYIFYCIFRLLYIKRTFLVNKYWLPSVSFIYIGVFLRGHLSSSVWIRRCWGVNRRLIMIGQWGESGRSSGARRVFWALIGPFKCSQCALQFWDQPSKDSLL